GADGAVYVSGETSSQDFPTVNPFHPAHVPPYTDGFIAKITGVSPAAPLANIATRGNVLTGDNVVIAGFIISGSVNKTVAITALGPSLGAFGIANPLANPTITLVRSSDMSTIATNDDWQTDANAAQLLASGFAPPNALEPGLVMNLPP